jgi:hypothetical protein
MLLGQKELLISSICIHHEDKRGGNDKEYSYFEIFLSPEALLEKEQ